jgi:hypothetical protein
MLIFGRRRAHEGLKVPLVGFCRETPRGPNPWFHVFPLRPKVGVSRLKTSYVSLKKTLVCTDKSVGEMRKWLNYCVCVCVCVLLAIPHCSICTNKTCCAVWVSVKGKSVGRGGLEIIAKKTMQAVKATFHKQKGKVPRYQESETHKLPKAVGWILWKVWMQSIQFIHCVTHSVHQTHTLLLY